MVGGGGGGELLNSEMFYFPSLTSCKVLDNH